MRRARDYLAAVQGPDGHWSPLWFGNQHRKEEENPTYGTSRVLRASDPAREDTIAGNPRRAMEWLLTAQNPDGGWGGGAGTPSTIEETALTVEALSATGCNGGTVIPACGGTEQPSLASDLTARMDRAISRGISWLIEHTDRGRSFEPSPIGFYFAKLWYWEELYPLIWTVGALEQIATARAQRSAERADQPDVVLCETAVATEPN
jgi:squalene-hopene/tetraprenyl-beta-curcumene cyclase